MPKKKRKSNNWVAEAICDALKELEKHPEWLLFGNKIPETNVKHNPDRQLHNKER